MPEEYNVLVKLDDEKSPQVFSFVSQEEFDQSLEGDVLKTKGYADHRHPNGVYTYTVQKVLAAGIPAEAMVFGSSWYSKIADTVMSNQENLAALKEQVKQALTDQTGSEKQFLNDLLAVFPSQANLDFYRAHSAYMAYLAKSGRDINTTNI